MAPNRHEAARSAADFGSLQFQHYQILTREDGSLWELGRGAMGVTFKAVDINLQIPVALKVLNSRFSSLPEASGRFLHEAQAAAQLRHPNVASVFHFGVVNVMPGLEEIDPAGRIRSGTALGDCFYAMEYVEGETLEACMGRLGPLPPLLVVEVGLQVVRALAAAEKRGLVHRDIKPANIMLVTLDGSAPGGESAPGLSDGSVKVIDFGLAQALTEENSWAEMGGRFLGTPEFASPEQKQGQWLDIRSDIFSLGRTLGYALTGKVVSEQAANDKDRADLFPKDLLRERGIPESLRKILQSMVATDPDFRPASAVSLGESLQACLIELQANSRSRWTRQRMLLSVSGLAVALIATGIGLFMRFGSLPDDKSVAVLPFDNVSADSRNGFLVDGIEDDLLLNLGKIRDLKVIGRQSTIRYPADAPRDLRAIGRALGVRHVLQGSLRRTENRIALQVSLIDTHDAHTLWAQSYNRSLADTIGLQGELTAAIAAALGATSTKQEQLAIHVQPTENPEAYLLYLRARQLESGRAGAITDYQAAEAIYSEAVAIDPAFALAHARLATTLSYLYRIRGPSADLRTRAHAEAHKALRLKPDLGEGHLALGLCYYHIDRDFKHALPELEQARQLLPNDAEPLSFIAYLHRRQGKWRLSIAEQQEAAALEPKNMSYEEELFATACLLRDWPEAALRAARMEALAPKLPQVAVQDSYLNIWRNGNLAPIQKLFAEMTYSDPEGDITWTSWDAAMLARDYARARRAIERFPFQILPSAFGAPIPKSYLEGCIDLAQGKTTEAQSLFELARPIMEAESRAHPKDALRHARLGLLYAYMGRGADAIREGELAVQIQPTEVDAYDGPERRCMLALIYARLGDNDEAIGLLESLLRKPGCVSFYEASLTLSELRLRWQWDPIRSDPRFQKILGDPEPRTIY